MATRPASRPRRNASAISWTNRSITALLPRSASLSSAAASPVHRRRALANGDHGAPELPLAAFLVRQHLQPTLGIVLFAGLLVDLARARAFVPGRPYLPQNGPLISEDGVHGAHRHARAQRFGVTGSCTIERVEATNFDLPNRFLQLTRLTPMDRGEREKACERISNTGRRRRTHGLALLTRGLLDHDLAAVGQQ